MKKTRRRHTRAACTKSVILEPEKSSNQLRDGERADVHLSLLRAVGVVSAVWVCEVVRSGVRVVTHRQWLKTDIKEIRTVCRQGFVNSLMVRN